MHLPFCKTGALSRCPVCGILRLARVPLTVGPFTPVTGPPPWRERSWAFADPEHWMQEIGVLLADQEHGDDGPIMQVSPARGTSPTNSWRPARRIQSDQQMASDQAASASCCGG